VGRSRCEFQLQGERAARGSKILHRPGWALQRFARFKRAYEGDALTLAEDGSLSGHVSIWPPNRLCGVCGGRSGPETRFYPGTSVFPCTCHYTIAHSFIYHTRCLQGLTSLILWSWLEKWDVNLTECVKVGLKQSHYRPGQAVRVPGVWGSQISRQSAHEGGKVVSPTHLPPLPAGNITGTHFCWRLSQPHGHNQWKISLTSSGIEPATIRLVAQCLNQLHYQQLAPSLNL
jgi:hypothetical protein